jgi:hypothetical protein
MSDRGNRAGDPLVPTVEVAGTVNTLAREYIFDAGDSRTYARVAYITNLGVIGSGGPVYVLVNEAEASPTNALFVVVAGQTVDLTANGRLNVTRVSVFVPTGVTFAEARLTAW